MCQYMAHLYFIFGGKIVVMNETVKYTSISDETIKSLGSMIPAQLETETGHAYTKLVDALGGDVTGFVANRLRMSPEELPIALAAEQVDGVALAIYNIEARGQSVVIGDQTGIGKGRQAAAMIRYGILAGYLPVFLTDRYTLFSDMYRDCKALGIKDARPLIINTRVSIVDFDKPLEDDDPTPIDEIWTPEEDSDEEELAGLYVKHYEEVYKSPKKSELELMYRNGDIPESRFEYIMLTYSQFKDARKDMTRLDFLTSLCEKHRVLFVFDEAHKSSSVTAGKISVITQSINSILEAAPQTQCVFLSATFAKRPECLITFMRQTILSSLATSDTLQTAFANGGVPMQEYVASMLAKEGQMVRREHSGEGIPEPAYTYLDDKLPFHSELFDKVMYWFRELVNLSDLIKEFVNLLALLEGPSFRPYPTRAQLFYVNKILVLSLKAGDVAEAAVREVQAGRCVVIGMSDTLECILRDSLDSETGECKRADFATILLRLLDKTLSIPKSCGLTIFDLDLSDIAEAEELQANLDEIRTYSEQIRNGITEDIFHLPMSPIDVIRQLISQESFTDAKGVRRNIRFEECTGRVRQLEYISPEGDDEFFNARISPRKKRHSNHIYNDFQNNKLDVILINACGAIGASAHAVATAEVPENEVRQRKMLIVQNDLDVNIDLQKRGRINRTGQIKELPPLYEYIITAIPSEKRLNMMLRAKLRSLSANTTANQDQDRRQADFVDITNKYGNLIAQEYLSANPELAFVLGLKQNSTASQLLARVAMLSVAAQQDIIEDLIGAYQNLEQELRRVNQWDLEREYRDFDAKFIREELFTAPIDDDALGGASMLTTFLCRHRTFPYDSAAINLTIMLSGNSPYGRKLSESEALNKEIESYYRNERKIIRDRNSARKQKLFATTLAVLEKYGVNENVARRLLTMAQRPDYLWDESLYTILKEYPQEKKITTKLKSYSKDLEDIEARETKELTSKSEQRKRLMTVISQAVIGQGYRNIISEVPVEEDISRIMAVLKEVRFGKNLRQRFLPGKVQFVFALSAVHKELVLNLVDKGTRNNYNRLTAILASQQWEFNAAEWNSEIAKYNNRVLTRKIITGNILGAFANPLINKIKPHFITFSVANETDGINRTERGLLLPMTGENVDNLIKNVSLPLGDGLKYTNSVNRVYQISGIGINFTVTPSKSNSDKQLRFCIAVNDKDSHDFEADTRFDTVRHYFKVLQVASIHNSDKAKPKKPLMHYTTEQLSSDSAEFQAIMTLLASLRTIILIPREYLTAGEMKAYMQTRKNVENSNWPALDWRNSSLIPPARHDVQVRISTPIGDEDDVTYVDEYPPEIALCNRTLAFQGRSFYENTMLGQIRALYFDWIEWCNKDMGNSELSRRGISYRITNDIHRILVNAANEPTICFDEFTYRVLKEAVANVKLSSVGKLIAKYREEMLFLTPPKEKVEEFLDSCLYDSRLDKIRKSLEDYLQGKTEIIMDI